MKALLVLALALGPTMTVSLAPTDLPAFDLVNYDGRPITNETFEGKTTIVVPTYAKCIFACPVVTFFLTELDRELGSPESVQYLHVSIQPNEDTADEILSHFDKHEIDARTDQRWLFANGSAANIEQLMRDLGIEITRTPVEGGFVIEHTIRLYVVGPDGKTNATFDTYFWNEEEMRHALHSSLE
jgi:protein SCO1/2